MRYSLDKNYYEGEIRFWKNARKDGSVAVIVEGKSDELFYQKFLSDETIFFPVDGFQNVIDILISFENDIKEVIGIIDADFRHCTNERITCFNIFITDFHDVEMMMIQSNAWDGVVSLHSQKTKLLKFQKQHSKPLREYILDMSRSIACVRFLNYKKKLGLKFKTMSKGQYIFLDHSKFIDKDICRIDNKKLLETIENKSEKLNFFENNPNLLIALTEISKNEFDLFDFCNGHDVINILSFVLKNVIGNKNISSQELESFFIVAYRFDDFSKTNLYNDLKKWEIDNPEIKLFD